jgi:hypothetical protein
LLWQLLYMAVSDRLTVGMAAPSTGVAAGPGPGVAGLCHWQFDYCTFRYEGLCA